MRQVYQNVSLQIDSIYRDWYIPEDYLKIGIIKDFDGNEYSFHCTNLKDFNGIDGQYMNMTIYESELKIGDRLMIVVNLPQLIVKKVW